MRKHQVCDETKCSKAHVSEAEQDKLDEAGRVTAAGNEWADELAKEGTRDDSFQSILYDTCKAAVEPSRAIISHIGNFILRAKGGARWPHVVAPPQGWDEKGASSQAEAQWKAMALRGVWQARKRWCSEGQNWHAQHARGIPQRRWGEQARPPVSSPDSDGKLRVVLQVWNESRSKFAKKLGEPCVAQSRSQEHARSARLPSSGWHPKEHRFFWIAEAVHSASLEEVAAKLPRGQLRQSSERKQAVDRLRSGEAQPTDPAD